MIEKPIPKIIGNGELRKERLESIKEKEKISPSCQFRFSTDSPVHKHTKVKRYYGKPVKKTRPRIINFYITFFVVPSRK